MEEIKSKIWIWYVFHLALVVKTTTGKNIIIEKNEIINISNGKRETLKNLSAQTMNVDMRNKQLKINQMLENTWKVLKNRRYFAYDTYDNNCQMFIKSILEENKVYSQAITDFLHQDITSFKKALPSFVPYVANPMLLQMSLLLWIDYVFDKQIFLMNKLL